MTQNKINFDDTTLLNKITHAFGDLRVDYDLSTDYDSIHKFEEKLESKFVDIGIFDNFVQKCQKQSGIVLGRRGTGKTHYLLLAHNRINNKWNEMKCLAIYLNLKHLNITGELPDELIERLFTVRIAQEFIRTITKIRKTQNLKDWLLSLLFGNNFDKCHKILINIQLIAEEGENTFNKLHDIYNEILNERKRQIRANIKPSELSFSAELENKHSEIISFLKTQTISIAEIRKRLCIIRNLLRLDSIVFFLDEWIKLDENLQGMLSKFIDTIKDDPIFVWIAVSPQRSYLGNLDRTADLPGFIELDSQLIYEFDDDSKILTEDYFSQLVNKKLETDVNDQIYNLTYNSFLGSGNQGLKKLRLLIWASMGNTRDFSILLGDAWERLRSIRTSEIKRAGQQLKHIHERHIEEAIKTLRTNKSENVSNRPSSKLLSFIRDFCIQKRSTHFVIPTDDESKILQQQELFKDILHYRLIHLRKPDFPNKENPMKPPLNIYAIDLPLVYEFTNLVKKKDAIHFYKKIQDRLLGYELNFNLRLAEIEKEIGNKIKCPFCSKSFDINNKVFEKTGLCPECGETIINSIK